MIIYLEHQNKILVVYAYEICEICVNDINCILDFFVNWSLINFFFCNSFTILAFLVILLSESIKPQNNKEIQNNAFCLAVEHNVY